MDVFWFLPTHGDGHYLGTTQGARPVTLNYLKQVAQAADSLGYHGVLIPTGRSCEDSWVIASALVPLTERLRYLVAIRPGIISPTVSARMAATLDRLSNGRLLINVVTGGDPDENRGDGSFLDHSERYEVSDEFLQIWRRVLQGESVDFEGKHLRVQNAKALYPPVQKPYPPLYFGGSSDAAHDLAAEQVDVYLTWGEPPAAVAEKLADVRERAARHGRTVKFGIRLHVIVRETEEDAWKAADKLIEHISDETIAAAQKSFSRFDSEGQRRMAALHDGRRDNLEIAPNLWAGVGLVRGGGRYRAGRQPAASGRTHQGIRGFGHRELYLLRLPAPGRSLSLCRTGVPAAAGTLRQPRRARYHQPHWPVWRNDCQRCIANNKGLSAVKSAVCGSGPARIRRQAN